ALTLDIAASKSLPTLIDATPTAPIATAVYFAALLIASKLAVPADFNLDIPALKPLSSILVSNIKEPSLATLSPAFLVRAAAQRLTNYPILISISFSHFLHFI